MFQTPTDFPQVLVEKQETLENWELEEAVSGSSRFTESRSGEEGCR